MLTGFGKDEGVEWKREWRGVEWWGDSLTLHFSIFVPAIPLCMVHLLEVPPVPTGWDARQDTTNTGKRLRVARRTFASMQKVHTASAILATAALMLHAGCVDTIRLAPTREWDWHCRQETLLRYYSKGAILPWSLGWHS